MLVGNNYTCFVIFLAKTVFEIGYWAALVTRYEEFKTTITRGSNIVLKNEFVHASTDSVLLIMYSCQIMYIHFCSNTVVTDCS